MPHSNNDKIAPLAALRVTAPDTLCRGVEPPFVGPTTVAGASTGPADIGTSVGASDPGLDSGVAMGEAIGIALGVSAHYTIPIKTYSELNYNRK